MVYTDGFKARLIQRMAGPEGISACALAQEVGVPQPTLSRWLRQGISVGSMSGKQSDGGAGDGRREWTAAEKLRILAEASQLSDADLGAFLRREGVREAVLRQWQRAATAGLEGASGKPQKKGPEAKRIKQLERELGRKDKALAEYAALLALQKKVRAIWGDGGDSTDTRSET